MGREKEVVEGEGEGEGEGEAEEEEEEEEEEEAGGASVVTTSRLLRSPTVAFSFPEPGNTTALRSFADRKPKSPRLASVKALKRAVCSIDTENRDEEEEEEE